jgi:hypothetical protein
MRWSEINYRIGEIGEAIIQVILILLIIISFVKLSLL